MDMNRALGVNSGSGKRAGRPGNLTRRRSTQRFDPQFEPKIERMETPEAHVLVAKLPGFKKEEVKVQLDGGENGSISGGRLIQDRVLIEGTWQPRRRMVSRFKKLFPIPKNVDIEGYTSNFENETMYITFNKLKAPPEVKSTDILDQQSKSIPEVGESSVKFIEELSDKMNDKASSNKLDQNLTNENVENLNVAKSNATQGEKASNSELDRSTKDEKVEAPKDANSSATQDDKASRNKQDQSPRDEKLETPTGVESTTTQDNKASSNDLDQSPRDEKLETPRGADSTLAQGENELSNKPHQIPRDERVETPRDANSTMGQDEKELSNKPHEVPREEIVEDLGGAKSIVAQDKKELHNKPHQIPREEMVEAPKIVSFSTTLDDKASSNKQEQNPKNEKLEIPRVEKSTTAQIDKLSNTKPDHSPRDEKVETPEGPKSTIAQENELSSKSHQNPRDEMIENKDVAKSSVAQDEKAPNNKSSQSSRDEKVQTLEATNFIATRLDDGKVRTPKVVSSSTTQETIQENTQLEASNKLEESAKYPSSLNEENLVDFGTLSNQSELVDSKKEGGMKVGNQHEQILNENPKFESTPLHEDQKQEEKLSSPKTEKEGDTCGFSQTKEDKHEKEKHYVLKDFTHVSQFISSRREVVVAGIVVFCLGLFITSKLTQ